MTPQFRIRHKEAGFTLIEVLCVLVMIGLLSGVVVMNMPSKKTAAQIQTENIVKGVNGLVQDGLISGEIRALGFSETDYAFYQYDGVNFNILKQGAWTDEVSPSLSLDKRRIALPEDLSPQIIFEPTGINTAFRLNLSGRIESFDIFSAGDGRVEMAKSE